MTTVQPKTHSYRTPWQLVAAGAVFATLTVSGTAAAQDSELILTTEGDAERLAALEEAAEEMADRLDVDLDLDGSQSTAGFLQQEFSTDRVAYLHVRFDAETATIFVLDPETQSIAAREMILDGSTSLAMETVTAALEATVRTLLDGSWTGEPLGELRRRYPGAVDVGAQEGEIANTSPESWLGVSARYEPSYWSADAPLRHRTLIAVHFARDWFWSEFAASYAWPSEAEGSAATVTVSAFSTELNAGAQIALSERFALIPQLGMRLDFVSTQTDLTAPGSEVSQDHLDPSINLRAALLYRVPIEETLSMLFRIGGGAGLNLSVSEYVVTGPSGPQAVAQSSRILGLVDASVGLEWGV